MNGNIMAAAYYFLTDPRLSPPDCRLCGINMLIKRHLSSAGDGCGGESVIPGRGCWRRRT